MQDEAERLQTAVALFQEGAAPEALTICHDLFQGSTGVAGAAYQLAALALNASDQLEIASRHLRRSILIHPAGRGARVNLAVVEERRGRLDELARQHRLLVIVDPICADAWHGLSAKDWANDEYGAAAEKNRRAMVSQPETARYLEAAADLAFDRSDAGAAARVVQWAFVTTPRSLDLVQKAVGYLGAINAHPTGLRLLEAALGLTENASLRITAGYMLRRLWRNPEAVDHFRRALVLEPTAADALLGLMWCRRQACDWDGDLAWLSKVHGLFLQTGEASPQPAFALAWSSDPGAQLTAARFVARAHQAAQPPTPVALTTRPTASKPDERIRIGYLSPNFGEHPVGRCIIETLERHDQTRFEIFAYASKSHPDHEITRRAQSCVEHFRDLDKAGEAEIHQRILDDRIEILVDLDGYSQGLPAVIAGRPAPVLVNFLGFAGTSGGLHDYLISDRSSIRPGTENQYAEEILWMPNCFLPPPTDTISAKPMPTRSDEGLPESGLVIAAFHTAFKITPDAFDAWCRILIEVPDAVLWLLDGVSPHADTVRAAAEKRGVPQDRLTFARYRPTHADHLARLPLADLYLDTFPHTAHSTAAELMFRGCPLITRTGDALASRIGASVLRAAGAAELVTDDWESFVEKAVDLCTTPGALDRIRQDLRDARAASPLFDRDGYARSLEEGYFEISARHRASLPPASIEIQR